MKSKKILVVDDELHITKILSFKLVKAGLSVMTASDGEEALRLACENKPDVILTDFHMPVLNGYRLAVRLRNEPRTSEIPLIMLTGRGHKLSPADLAKTNITALIPKPFSAREVLAKVQALVELIDDGTEIDNGCGPGSAVA
ncbi:MAG: response regulator [Pirellulaceae bacterium]|nr:response regulator [Pirellulaceae bacterium]